MTTIYKYKNKEIYGTYHTRYETDMINYLIKKLEDNNLLNKICIEFGASDGIGNSNTRHLLINGWKGIQIEPVKERFDKLSELYKKDNNRVKCILGSVSPKAEDLNSFDNIVGSIYSYDSFILDVASIDVDSCDYQIFKSINRCYPKIILVEPNAHIPAHHNEGISSMTDMAATKGYKLLGYTGNLIYCHENYFHLMDLQEQSPEQAWNEYWEHLDFETKNHVQHVVDIKNYWKL